MDDSSLDDAVRAARDGDERAFATLFRALQPPLLRYLRVLSGAEADDVAADVWLEIAHQFGRFEGDGSAFRRWLFATARRRGLDRHRRNRRRSTVALVDRDAPAEPDPDPADLAAAVASSAEALALVARLLPPDQAEIVILRAVAGFDVAEVAQITGHRPGTVRVLAHRGLRRLAEHLQRRPSRKEV
jgi:RNA polymerase sigma-70 factor (ECF subfamily)